MPPFQPSGPLSSPTIDDVPHFKLIEQPPFSRERFPLKDGVLGTRIVRQETYGISDEPSGVQHHPVA